MLQIKAVGRTSEVEFRHMITVVIKHGPVWSNFSLDIREFLPDVVHVSYFQVDLGEVNLPRIAIQSHRENTAETRTVSATHSFCVREINQCLLAQHMVRITCRWDMSPRQLETCSCQREGATLINSRWKFNWLAPYLNAQMMVSLADLRIVDNFDSIMINWCVSRRSLQLIIIIWA